MSKLRFFLFILLITGSVIKTNAQSFIMSADTVFGTVHYCPNSVNLIDTVTASASVNMWWHVVASNFPADWRLEMLLVDNTLAYSNLSGALWDGTTGGYRHATYLSGISAFQFQTTFSTTVSLGTHWLEVQLTDTVTHYSKNIWFVVSHTADTVLPDAGAITGPLTVCLGSGITLTDAIGGGSWSSTTIGVATIGSSTGIITSVAPGTATISYTVTNSCGTAAATKIVTVMSLPDAGTITGTAALCTGGATTTLSDAVTGGTWSSIVTPVATVGSSTGIVTSVSAGTATISYTVTNSCGSAAAIQIVTVETFPVAGSITGNDTVCAGGATTALSDAVAGGVWSSVATAVGTVGATGIVTGISAGTTTISYTVANSCGAVAATTIVTVNPLADAGTIAGSANICLGGAAITLSDAITGGTWSSAATGIATVSSVGVVSSVSAGTAIISYAVANSCGTVAATQIVTVTPLPDAGTITAADTVCTASSGASITMSASVPAGTWHSANDHASISGTTVTGVSEGIDTVYYIVTNACGSDTASHILAVVSCPEAVNAITALDDITIYPNPATTQLIISAGYNISKLTISNILGQTRYSHNCNAEKITVDVSALPAGIYIVSVNIANAQKAVVARIFIKE